MLTRFLIPSLIRFLRSLKEAFRSYPLRRWQNNKTLMKGISDMSGAAGEIFAVFAVLRGMWQAAI